MVVLGDSVGLVGVVELTTVAVVDSVHFSMCLRQNISVKNRLLQNMQSKKVLAFSSSLSSALISSSLLLVSRLVG